jgi:hypothetical protein
MKWVFCLFAILATGCPPAPPSPPTTGDECEGAYGHLVSLRCEPIRPTSGTWVDVCRNARRNGLFSLRCVRAARDRDTVQSCGVSCE